MALAYTNYLFADFSTKLCPEEAENVMYPLSNQKLPDFAKEEHYDIVSKTYFSDICMNPLHSYPKLSIIAILKATCLIFAIKNYDLVSKTYLINGYINPLLSSPTPP